MKYSSDSKKRVSHYLQQMKKAMPEIKRQVAVYEKSQREGSIIKSPEIAPQFKNV